MEYLASLWNIFFTIERRSGIIIKGCLGLRYVASVSLVFYQLHSKISRLSLYHVAESVAKQQWREHPQKPKDFGPPL